MNGRKVKSILVVVLILIIPLLLTGCLKGDFHVKINRDGSADLNYKIGFNSYLISMLESADDSDEDIIESLKKDLEDEGFEVTYYKENDISGVIAKKHQESLDDLSIDIFQQNLTAETNGSEANAAEIDSNINKITVNKGFFQNEYIVKANFDLTSMQTENNNSEGTEGDTNQLGKGIADAMLNQIDLNFILTLPVKPENHNASQVTNEGKTLTWNLKPGANNEVKVEAKVLNFRNMSLLIVGLLVLIALITFYYYKNRQNIKY